jgi:hypothetical protein
VGALNKDVFKQGEDAYGQVALELFYAGVAGQRPAIPPIAKHVYGLQLERVLDRKIRKKYVQSIAEAFSISYTFSLEESWEDLDKKKAKRLMNTGLEALRREQVAMNVPDPLIPADAFCRVHYPTLGLVGGLSEFADFTDYMFSRAASERVETLKEFFLTGILASGFRSRDAEKLTLALHLAWGTGRAIGMLAVLGEVPPEWTPDAFEVQPQIECAVLSFIGLERDQRRDVRGLPRARSIAEKMVRKYHNRGVEGFQVFIYDRDSTETLVSYLSETREWLDGPPPPGV